MITALQSSKLTACNKLLQAQQLVAECRSLICMGEQERAAMQSASDSLDGVVKALAPSNKTATERRL